MRMKSLLAAALLSSIATVGSSAPVISRREDPYAKASKHAYKTKKKNGEPRKTAKSPLLAAPYGKKRTSKLNRDMSGTRCKAKR